MGSYVAKQGRLFNIGVQNVPIMVNNNCIRIVITIFINLVM